MLLSEINLIADNVSTIRQRDGKDGDKKQCLSTQRLTPRRQTSGLLEKLHVEDMQKLVYQYSVLLSLCAHMANAFLPSSRSSGTMGL